MEGLGQRCEGRAGGEKGKSLMVGKNSGNVNVNLN